MGEDKLMGRYFWKPGAWNAAFPQDDISGFPSQTSQPGKNNLCSTNSQVILMLTAFPELCYRVM
jgi:hypothetical protein